MGVWVPAEAQRDRGSLELVPVGAGRCDDGGSGGRAMCLKDHLSFYV